MAPAASSSAGAKKSANPPERKYKCQFCNRAFSRSEHRSRHERSRMLLFFVLSMTVLTTKQTQRNVPSSVSSVARPLSAATCSSATTAPSTQRMAASRSSLKAVAVVVKPLPLKQPRPPPQQQPQPARRPPNPRLPSIRPLSTRWTPTVMEWSTSKPLPCS
jgi:hypothetical protein